LGQLYLAYRPKSQEGRSLTTFEQGFEDTERAADAAAKAVGSLLAAAKQLKKAAHEGDTGAIRKSSERLGLAIDAVRQEVVNARGTWPFGEDAEDEYLRNEYESELMAAARASGLRMDQRDGRLLAFPSIVRVIPADRSLRIDRKRVLSIRPSRIIAALKANQTKKPRFAPDRFLESLFRAYRLIAGPDTQGSTQALADVYEAFTLLPGATAEYGQSDFARDLFILDRSGLTRTKSGASFSLPASTGTKGAKGTFTFVAPEGELITYFGVWFGPAL
jgi:hypothetical protein